MTKRLIGKGRATAIAYAVIIPLFAFQHFGYYGTHVYDADVAKEWLWRARATNDLTDMRTYLTNAYDGLANYHGNPEWFYPKPDTDYGLIKGNIQETIATAQAVERTESVSSFAYQQAVQNLQETIVEIAEHLELANKASLFSPVRNPMWWVFSITLILGYIPALVRGLVDGDL